MSGYTWEKDPAQQGFDGPGMNRRSSLRAVHATDVTAIAKRSPRAHPEDVCGLAMERIASRLGDILGAPVPKVWLENHENEPAAIIRRIPHVLNWQMADKAVLPKITNDEALAAGVLLDIWLANYDRYPRNLLLQPLPAGSYFSQAESYAAWLIDHGLCGLLWAKKFDDRLGLRDVDQVCLGTDCSMLPAAELQSRAAMPMEYKSKYWAMDKDDRGKLLDRVRDVADDCLDETVDEIPDVYMDSGLRDKTKALLKGRRDQIDSLVSSPWP